MEIPSYVFQSPYPSAVQVGRPDPQAQVQQSTDEAVNAFAETGDQVGREAEIYTAQVSTGASVNVALSSSDAGLSSSLQTFSDLNTQVQAQDAYSS